MDYNNFRAETIKLNTNKKFRVSNSYGTKQAWRWIKKNKWLNIGQPLTEYEFGQIIKAVHRKLKERLLIGHDINLPHYMGRIELRKNKTKVEIKDGKLSTTRPIDWKSTLKLWYEDEQAYNKRLLVRQEQKEVFRVYYNKHKAKYKNKMFYKFTPSRALKLELKDKIENDNIDAFLLCNTRI